MPIHKISCRVSLLSTNFNIYQPGWYNLKMLNSKGLNWSHLNNKDLVGEKESQTQGKIVYILSKKLSKNI